MPLVDTTDAAVVGDGTPASCTEERLREAVDAGGIIRFDCGPEAFTFTLSEPLIPGRQECLWEPGKPCSRVDTVIDGEGRITLDGNNSVRPITFDTADFEDTTLTLTVQRLRIVNGNSSEYGGDSGCGKDLAAGGGAIMLVGGNLRVIDCEFENNVAAPQGPDVAGGALYARGLGTMTVSGSVFRGNSAATGGAIGLLATSLEVVNSTIVDNEAVGVDCGGNGGAIYMDGSGSLQANLCGVTIANNVSTRLGGAMFRTAYGTQQTTTFERSTLDGNSSTEGGGALYLQGTPVTLENTTISNNRAGGAAVWVLDHNSSEFAAPGQLNMTNVTITGNHNSGGGSSALNLERDSTGLWQNITVTDNPGEQTLGIWVHDGATATVTNSILEACLDGLNGDRNLQWPAGDADCTPGITTADPQLGELTDNGGPTATRAPGANSPAIGAGSECTATDQRGEPRAAACTLGAVESSGG